MSIIFAVLIYLSLQQVELDDDVSAESYPKPLTYLSSSQMISVYARLQKYPILYSKLQLSEIGSQGITSYIINLSREIQVKRILIIVGSNQNGLYGLSTARRMKIVGMDVDVIQLIKPNKLHNKLIKQARSIGVKVYLNIISSLSKQYQGQFTYNMLTEFLNQYDLIIDAVSLRQIEMKPIIRQFLRSLEDIKPEVISINLPCGWDPDYGNTHRYFTPYAIYSVFLPLKGLNSYRGSLVVGGRLMPADWNSYVQPTYRGEDEYLQIQ